MNKSTIVFPDQRFFTCTQHNNKNPESISFQPSNPTKKYQSKDKKLEITNMTDELEVIRLDMALP